MNVLTASANQISDLYKDIVSFVGHPAMDIESCEKPNDAADFTSAKSSYSDFTDFVLPPDIPDGPIFYDLAGHIDKVTQQVINHSDEVFPGVAPMHNFQTDPIDLGPSEVNDITLQNSLQPTGLVNACSSDHPLDESQDVSQQPIKLTSIAAVDVLSSSVDDCSFDYSLPENPEVFPNSTQEAQLVNGLVAVKDREKLLTNFHVSLNAGSTECEDPAVDDDFGDFECSAPAVTTPDDTDYNRTTNSSTCHTNNGVLERLLSHLGPILARNFETSTDEMVPSEDSTSHVTRHPLSPDYVFEPCILPQLVSTTRPRNRRYKWDNSAIYEAYLESVHVDKSSSVPARAPRLELLQPVRLKAPNPTISSDVTIETGQSCVSQAEDSLTPNSHTTTNVPILSAPLDLDFLEMNHSDSMTSPKNPTLVTLSALELELLTQVPEAPVPIKSPLAPSSLDTQPKPTSTLRDNVRAALARLPKLTYMRSRHLNFPISDVRHNS